MTITARFRISLIVLLFLVLPFTGCSSSDERDSVNRAVSTTKRFIGFSRAFPVPSKIKDNVAFWRNVYGKWSRGEVAIHDDEYMGVIYEVTDLPDPTLEGYTAEQKRFVQARKVYYKRRLADLEDRIRAGLSPSRYDRALYNKLKKAGGRWAIYGDNIGAICAGTRAPISGSPPAISTPSSSRCGRSRVIPTAISRKASDTTDPSPRIAWCSATARPYHSSPTTTACPHTGWRI